MKFSSLICEFKDEPDKNGELKTQKYVSLGRFSFWITFAIMTFMWFNAVPVPDSLFNVFMLMVLYNFFKKPLMLLDAETLLKFMGRK